MSTKHSKQTLLKRTAKLEKELAAKSYGLKIEAALEKVSIAAMSMRRSKDLSGIGSLIFKELKKLGFTDLRNSEIIINNDAKETITSYYYSDYGVTGVIELDYKSNAIVKGWADQLKKASNAFAEVVIPGKEMKAWRKYREEIGYLPDPKLDKAKTVYYYSYSTGPGALSISSFKPVAKEQIKILKRFRNVFQLSYQRYADITLAAGQAREAEIELALERVRVKTMAMQKSDELQETTLVLFQQFKSLGVTAAQVSICVFDEDTRMGEMFVTLKGEKIDRSFPMELNKEVFVMKKAKKAFLDKQKKISFTVKGKELQEYNHWRNSLIGKKGWDESNAVRKQSWYVDGVFFSRGMMGISSNTPVAAEASKLLDRFAGVFDLTFKRFLDLQKAEAQAREAEIELALERVRARTMAMQKSDELPETTFLLFQQLKELGETAAQLSIGIIKEEQGVVELSATVHGSPLLQTYLVPASDPYFMQKVIKPWKAKEKFLTVEIRGKELKEYNKWRNSVLKKKIVFPEKQWIINVVFFSKGMISFSSDKHISHESIQLLERFAGVFDLTYTRFLDLQTAEAQTREAKIEAALERVRASSMAMHRSDELDKVIKEVTEQLILLGFDFDASNITIDPTPAGLYVWNASPAQPIPSGVYIPYKDIDIINWIYSNWAFHEGVTTKTFNKAQKNAFFKHYFTHTEARNISDERKTYILNAKSLHFSFACRKDFALGLLNYHGITYKEEQNNILAQFAKVFEQSYIRFLDLQKAEAQTKESQIQLALERIRARTMTMHKSEELAETAQVLFHQLQELGAIPDRITIGVADELEGVVNFWSTDESGSHIDKSFKARLSEKKVMAKSYQAWKDHKKSLIIDLHGDDVKKWIQFVREETGLDFKDEFIKDRRVHNVVFFSHGWIQVTTHELQPAETIEILERFASVFSLTYRRFLDLQRAEAQAREAQIEAALERVRGRSMAMHNSSELHDVIKVVTEQLSGLGIKFDHASFGKNDAAGNWDLWISTPEQAYPSQIHLPYFDHRIFNDQVKTNLDFFTELYSAEEKNIFFRKFFETTEARNIPEERKQYVLNDKGVARSFFRLKNLWFVVGKYDDKLFTDEENNIFKRFAMVFEQSYTRFLDLQKAEAQTREAHIETALERVRAKAMAMHSSKDLSETISVFYRELKSLSVTPRRCGVALINKETLLAEITTMNTTEQGDSIEVVGQIKMKGHPVLDDVFENWLVQKEYHAVLRGNQIKEYYQVLKPQVTYPDYPHDVVQYGYYFMFKEGDVYAWTDQELKEDELKIYRRFTTVISLTYKRYKDLQQAEAQAREAQVEVALERVRARTMAMFASDELAETAVVVYKQMNGLGIIANRLYIVIINDDSGNMEFWITDENGEKIGSRHLVNVNKNISLKTMFDGWANNKKTIIIDQQANELQDWLSYWKENFHISFKDDDIIKRRVQTIAYFSKGFIAMASPDDQPQETIQVLERFAAVFNLTYTRFLDLQKAEAQAREAQIETALERVRSRTMAMHNSDDVGETVGVTFDELKRLGIEAIRCGIGIVHEHKNMEVWTAKPGETGKTDLIIGHIDMNLHALLQGAFNGWSNKDESFSYELKGNDLVNYFTAINNHSEYPVRYDITTLPSVIFHNDFYFFEGTLFAFTTTQLSEEFRKILKRFAAVFGQTYRRYLDLQKAEAQAKEAKTEAALERVRSKTMAMHNSNDVGETVEAMFAEFVHLGIRTNRCGILIFNDQHTAEVWTARSTPGGNAKLIIGRLDLDAHRMLRSVYNAWKAKETFYQYDLLDQDLVQYYTAINNSKFYPTQFDLNTLPSKEFHSDFFFADGAVFSFTNEPVAEEHAKIIKRFALVFGQTYRRYLDLQKAEAQARESQIQLSMERVRARAMAMHGSDELNDLVKTLFEELIRLDVKLATCLISTFDISTLDETSWMFHPITREPYVKRIPYNEQPFYHEMLRAWKERNAAWNYCLEGETKVKWHDFLFTDTEFALLPQSVIDEMRRPDKVFFTASYYSYGAIQAASLEPFPVQSIDIIQRFSKVFDLSYTRFLDLQKAEAQTRESKIQLSLERVRARTMAMHKSEELPEVAEVLYNQLKDLGDDPERITIGIMSEDNRVITWWATDQGGSKLNFRFQATADEPTVMLKLYDSWKAKHTSLVVDLTGPELSQWVKYCREVIGVPINEEILQNRRVQTVGFFSHGCVMITSPHLPDPETINILERFATVFGLTYRRFLDLQKAEAQAREATIEAALERVRAKAMAMHNSEDLNETIKVFYQQVSLLSLTPRRCGVGLFNKENKIAYVSVMNTTEQGESVETIGKMELTGHPVLKSLYDHWLSQQDYFPVLRGNQIKEYYQVLRPHLNYPDYPNDAVQFGYFFCFPEGALYAWTTQELPEEELNIYRRFTSVLSLTYKRYKDLKQAEAQAREAQIEVSLERVRSKTMAMHSSDDVTSATATMFTELERLGIENMRCGIAHYLEDHKMEVWSVSNLADGKVVRGAGLLDTNSIPFWKIFYSTWQKKEDFLYYLMAGKEKEDYFKKISTLQNYLSRSIEDVPDLSIQTYYFPEGSVWAFSLKPHSEEDKQVMKRFASVFSLTFRRYQDLKKAEAQAREATIEAAMEKVRSSAMAMHSSNDISSTTTVVFEELRKLNIHSKRCGVALLSKDSHTCHVYAAATSSDGKFHTLRRSIEMTQHHSLEQQYESWIKQENYIVEMRDEELRSYYQLPFFYSSPDYVPPTNYEHTEYGYYIPFSEGLFYAWTEEPYLEDEINILNRFKKIVDLTFRRYFDLQKAEAQAREATIEAALEKVRGKAMAMHNSNDLSVTASMVFTELRKLGINPIRCGVGLLNKESRKAQLYSATSSADGDSLSLVGWAILSEHPVLEKIYQSWMDNEEYYPELQGEQMRLYYQLLLKGLPVAAPQVEDDKKQFGTFLPFSVGCLYAWSEAPYNETEIKVLKRFATIIDLTFRRYLELQKSEANAREAVKQAAVDRIRADIASMRTIGDLDRITPLIWNELTILGLSFIRCGVFIMDNSQKLIHTFLSTPDGKAIGAFHLPYDTPGNFSVMLKHWLDKETYISRWDEVDFIGIAEILVQQGSIATKEQYLSSLPKGGFYLHFLPFLQGMLYVGNTEKLNDEQIELIQHVADAFSTAYARYEDFNKLEAAKQQVEKTLTDLKQAQTQLVQSEKMASLGELTAGIAHEIQNPLNFVNNFSEVSNELLEEMKMELEKGNNEDALAIAKDVKQNLEKINHHGKRADSIVKGMLQHSRTSSGQKEMTDINALADEYLRLAYHGLRAKEKSFNAKFETSFDENVGEINIIPQDIGRVILNLINNAFYAVSERKKAEGVGFEPTVKILTASIQPLLGGRSVQIKVADNGGGITQKVLDKIFQPFFTTKPTGQGTGLGLSLAYDIIKAHGGDIKVETKEGEGSEFIIQLPVV